MQSYLNIFPNIEYPAPYIQDELSISPLDTLAWYNALVGSELPMIQSWSN